MTRIESNFVEQFLNIPIGNIEKVYGWMVERRQPYLWVVGGVECVGICDLLRLKIPAAHRVVAQAVVSKRKNAYGEWVVRAYSADGQRMESADYHTTDKDDAETTAGMMVGTTGNFGKADHPDKPGTL